MTCTCTCHGHEQLRSETEILSPRCAYARAHFVRACARKMRIALPLLVAHVLSAPAVPPYEMTDELRRLLDMHEGNWSRDDFDHLLHHADTSTNLKKAGIKGVPDPHLLAGGLFDKIDTDNDGVVTAEEAATPERNHPGILRRTNVVELL